MDIKGEVLVISADQYSVENSTGCTVFYLGVTSLEPVVNSKESYGMKPAKANLPIEALNDLPYVPGKYMAEFVMRPNSKGQNALTISKLRFVSKIALVEKLPGDK